MSLRTYINDVQIFGNNDRYPEWEQFISAQGIKITEDGCYTGQITDIMGAIKACEDIIMRVEDERRAERERLAVEKDEDPEIQQMLEQMAASQFDLTEVYKTVAAQKNAKYGMSLFDRLIGLTQNGCMFTPYAVWRACEEHVEFDTDTHDRKRMYILKVKPGHVIPVKAG